MKKHFYLFIIPLLTACFSLQKNSIGTVEQADELANKIIAATHQEHWASTKVIQWTFGMGNRSHIWDKERELEYVKFGNYEVWMSLKTKQGVVKKDGELVDEADKQKYLEKAYSYWVNDSFWLNPIAKFYDEGITRSLVNYKGDTALFVSYSQGGQTPGDSYLWLIDEKNKPKAWKLWVSIIPIKGFRFTWEDWEIMDSGVMLATEHHNTLTNVHLSNVKAVTDIHQLFGDLDPFFVLFLD